MSEIGKKARASTKGGSLHISGAQSQGTIRRKLEKELGRLVTQAEAFKATHTMKKKNPEDPDVWVEPRAQETYEQYLQDLENFRQTQPEDIQGMPLSQEQCGSKGLIRCITCFGGILPCPSDVACPPRPSQSRPTQPPV